MSSVIIYIHGKGGSAEEAEHYRPLFRGCDVIGFEYEADTPWDAKEEFSEYFSEIFKKYSSVSIIANSIGAFFAMHALWNFNIEKAFFISPVTDMEKLICNMMMWSGVSEEELKLKREIFLPDGSGLSWDYLCYVRNNPVIWNIPTHILYGENDNLTSFDTVTDFASRTSSTLTVMKNGEHWFHTQEQMEFIDNWIRRFR